jgi:two-component system chemotaxis response regulator CheB
MEAIASELISKIKVAAQTRVPKTMQQYVVEPAAAPPQKEPVQKAAPSKVVAIGVSTGGPNAVNYVLSQLPADFPGTILIVQHMPEGFTEMFAHRLNESCAIEVKEAQSGDLLVAGRALICPGNRHMKVKRMPLGQMVVLTDDEKVNGHRPSVDVLFHSVAQEFGSQALGVIMTGMGEDGAEGLGEMKRMGAMTIAQSEESCVVFGMPKAAIERGHAIRVVPLDALANTLQAQCGAERGAAVGSKS